MGAMHRERCVVDCGVCCNECQLYCVQTALTQGIRGHVCVCGVEGLGGSGQNRMVRFLGVVGRSLCA